MKASPREFFALRDYLDPNLKARSLSDARLVVSLTDVAAETCIQGRRSQLGSSSATGRCGQLLAALAMIGIDGVARRNAAVSARSNLGGSCRNRCSGRGLTGRVGGLWVKLVVMAEELLQPAPQPQTERATEWLMLPRHMTNLECSGGRVNRPRLFGQAFDSFVG
jgi:hypothetical protein